ncbi:hypothetical protein F66182_2858 [Fusarium sp. NRRL 66182]|nr:hypothetical protein F66182_2858 [Fusarium sp. NRRL 66182]
MAGDVEGLADHLNLETFHIVGVSKGGPVAYTVAEDRPRQVKSLALLFTSPGVSAELPIKDGLDLGLQPILGGFGNERETHIRLRMTVYDALTTQSNQQERREAEELSARITDRDIKGGTLYSKGPNHGAASHEGSGWPGVETLREIRCPTTVLQAAEDQIFGEIHGEALVRAIPGDVEYVLWNDVGHEMPKRIWARLAEVLQRTWVMGEGTEKDGDAGE